MNIWSELGIERTQDLRTIKRAYAKRLKTTKPDEQPEDFQRLYKAYKAALADASNSQEAIRTEAPSVNKEVSQNSYQLKSFDEKQTKIELQPEVSQKELEERKKLQEHWAQEGERLLMSAKTLLASTVELHYVESWRFFEQSPLIINVSFNEQLGVAVFRLLTEHQAMAKKYYRLSAQVVTYLDAVFGWSNRIPYLYSMLGQHATDRILRLVEHRAVSSDRNMGLRGGKEIIHDRPDGASPIDQKNNVDLRKSKNNIVYWVFVIVIVLGFIKRTFSPD